MFQCLLTPFSSKILNKRLVVVVKGLPKCEKMSPHRHSTYNLQPFLCRDTHVVIAISFSHILLWISTTFALPRETSRYIRIITDVDVLYIVPSIRDCLFFRLSPQHHALLTEHPHEDNNNLQPLCFRYDRYLPTLHSWCMMVGHSAVPTGTNYIIILCYPSRANLSHAACRRLSGPAKRYRTPSSTIMRSQNPQTQRWDYHYFWLFVVSQIRSEPSSIQGRLNKITHNLKR